MKAYRLIVKKNKSLIKKCSTIARFKDIDIHHDRFRTGRPKVKRQEDQHS